MEQAVEKVLDVGIVLAEVENPSTWKSHKVISNSGNKIQRLSAPGTFFFSYTMARETSGSPYFTTEPGPTLTLTQVH